MKYRVSGERIKIESLREYGSVRKINNHDIYVFSVSENTLFKNINEIKSILSDCIVYN